MVYLYWPIHWDDLQYVQLEQSFRHYLKNIPGSTIVGHLNSNATEEELMVLRKKIADTILGMQQLEREKEERRLQDGSKALETAEPECYIEVTRVSGSISYI